MYVYINYVSAKIRNKDMCTKYQPGWQMGRVPTSHSGRSGNLKIAGSSPDPASLNQIDDFKIYTGRFEPGTQHYKDRARTGWFSVRVI